ILVLTANASAIMTTGVSAAFAPLHKAAAVQLNLTKAGGNYVSGSITIVKASDESDITYYNLYWASDANNKLSSTAFISLPKTAYDLIYQLSPPITKPTDAIYVLAFTENKLAEMNSDTNAGLPPLNKPLTLTLNVTKDSNQQLTGIITIIKAADE